MNLPNKLTVLRLILVPFFVAALFVPIPPHMLIALLIFAAASFTDHLDGRIARKYNLITDFGKFPRPRRRQGAGHFRAGQALCPWAMQSYGRCW